MRIKFIKVEEGLETRGNKATGKVSRAVTGHVVTPRGGKVGVDDDPANPTKKLKAMVRRGYKAKAQNSSTEILGNKMVEGFNKLFQEATISKSRGKGKGEIVKDVKLSKGALEAAKKRGTKVPGGYSVPSKGKRLPTEIAEATQILGNKIVEGIFDLFGARARKARNFRSGEGARDPQAFSSRVKRTFDRANEPAVDAASKAQRDLDTKGYGYSTRDVHPSVANTAVHGGSGSGSERDPVATHAIGDDKDKKYPATGPSWNPGGREASKAAYQKDADAAHAKVAAGNALTRDQGIEAANTRQRRLALRSKLLAKSGSGGDVVRKVRTGLSRVPGIGSMFRPKRRGLRPQMGGYIQRTSGFTEQERFGYAICESFNNLLNEYRGKHSGYKKGEAPARGSEEAKTVAKRTRFERGAAEAGSKDPNLAKSRLRMVATGKYPDGAPASLEDKKQMGRIVARTGKVAKRAGGKPVSREGAGVRSREENNQRNKKEESLDYTHNDRFDEISHKLKQRAAKAAEKKAKEHAKIADAAKKVGARDTEVIHDKISRSKTTQADKFKGNTGGEDKRGKQQYHQAKKEAGIGTRRVPVSKR